MFPFTSTPGRVCAPHCATHCADAASAPAPSSPHSLWRHWLLPTALAVAGAAVQEPAATGQATIAIDLAALSLRLHEAAAPVPAPVLEQR
jgi:hypothetical protein